MIREQQLRSEQKQLGSDMAYIDALLDSRDEGTEPAERIKQVELMRSMRDQIRNLLASDPATIYELCCELNIPGPRLPRIEPSSEAAAK